MTEIETLLELLKTHPVGPIDRQTDLGRKVFDGLQKVWSSLAGASDQSTFANKLWRLEQFTWSPPLIIFVLDRHGGTVKGSSRAEVHTWEVDLANYQAKIVHKTYRQLTKADIRLDCKKLAREVAEDIGSGLKCEHLEWDDTKQRVTVKISTLIPEFVKQTTQGRRKRFREAFFPLMNELGWEDRSTNNRISFSRPVSLK